MSWYQRVGNGINNALGTGYAFSFILLFVATSFIYLMQHSFDADSQTLFGTIVNGFAVIQIAINGNNSRQGGKIINAKLDSLIKANNKVKNKITEIETEDEIKDC